MRSFYFFYITRPSGHHSHGVYKSLGKNRKAWQGLCVGKEATLLTEHHDKMAILMKLTMLTFLLRFGTLSVVCIITIEQGDTPATGIAMRDIELEG